MSRAVAFLLLLLTGCVPRPMPAPISQTELDRVRDQTSRYLRSQVIEAWEQWIGNPPHRAPLTGPDPNELFAPATIDLMRRALRAPENRDNREALHHLHAYLVGEFLRRQVGTLERRRFDLIHRPLDPQGLSLATLRQALALEPSATRRQRLTETAAAAVPELLALNQRREAALDRAALALGYKSRQKLWSELRRYEVHSVRTLATTLLDETDALYEMLLREQSVAEISVERSQLTFADLPRLMAAPRFTSVFPAGRLLDATEATLTKVGLEKGSWPAHLDALPTPTKNPRAACFPIEIPTDIRLSVKPSGGAKDFAEFLHEVGHALHFAHTRPTAPELATLGDASSSEAFAFVFEGLASDPAWLAWALNVETPERTAYARLAVLRDLLMARRQAALVLDNLNRDAEAPHASALKRAYGVTMSATDLALATVHDEPFLEAADYLRGYVLAAMLRVELRAAGGACWWQHPAALALLTARWRSGEVFALPNDIATTDWGRPQAIRLAHEFATRLTSVAYGKSPPSCESIPQ